MNTNHRRLFTVVVVFAIAMLACSPLGGGAATKTPPAPVATAVPQSVESTATPQTGAATQATGAPNSSAECGDNKTAWASAGNDGLDNLELVYTTTVVPVAVNIYETNGPGSIVKVDVLEAKGAAHTVYTGLPLPTQQCPRTLSIGITGMTSKVNRVKIYVDQSVVRTWDEIDAVELVGNP